MSSQGSRVRSPVCMGVSREGPGLAGEEEGQMVVRGLSPGWTPSTTLPVYSSCPCSLGSSCSQRLRCKGQSAPLQSVPHFRAVTLPQKTVWGEKPRGTANLQQNFLQQEAPGSLRSVSLGGRTGQKGSAAARRVMRGPSSGHSGRPLLSAGNSTSRESRQSHK